MRDTTNYIKVIFFVYLALADSTLIFSQIEQPNRYEIEQKYSDEDFTIVPLKEEGLALIREINKYKSGNRTWEVILLDSTLHETGKVEFEINSENHLIGFEHSPGYAYFLFKRNEIKGYMDLLSLNLENRNVDLYEIKPELQFQITQFSKAGENFIFGGFVNQESAILLYNPAIDNLKIVPGFFQKNIELIDIRVNINHTFNVLLFDRGDHDSKKIIFRTFDSSGKQLLEDLTTIDDDIVLHTGITSALERDDLIILGTWGKLNSKQASGFYALPVNPFGEQKIKRIHFGELNHYLDYLKPKRANTIKLKTSDDLQRKKIPDFSNYVMPFKIIEHSTGFLLLAECYTPSNTTNQYAYSPYNTDPYYSPFGGYYPTNRVYSPYSRSYGNNIQNTEEVKTIESVVIAFDASGQVLWDQSIKLSGIKMPSLNQISEFLFNGSQTHFLYKEKSQLKIKTITLKNYTTTENIVNIQLKDPMDEVSNESKQVGSIKHWFGNNFYVWGNQSIRNEMNSKNRSREVFYINKVAVH